MALDANDPHKQQQNQSPTANADTGEVSGSTPEHLPKDGQQGITTHPTEERERQEKVISG